MSYVQKVSASVDGVGSIAPVITGVTLHNTLVLIVGTTDTAQGNASYGVPTDSASVTGDQTWLKAVGPIGVGASSIEVSKAAIYYLLDAKAGTHTLSQTWSGGDYGAYTLLEIPACSALDVVTSNGGTTSVTTGSTGTTATTTQANDAVIVALTTNTSGAGLANSGFTDPPSGYTSLFAQQNTSAHTGAQYSYLETSSAGAQSATWTWTNGAQTSWQAVIASFKFSAAPAATSPPARRAFPLSVLMQ